MKAKVHSVGALVLFSSNLERAVSFYRSLGIELEREQHDDAGSAHYACDLDGTHFAIFPAETGAAPKHRTGGATFPGFTVESVVASLESARATGARVKQEPEMYPWGLRAVLEDPDGRFVEIFEPHK